MERVCLPYRGCYRYPLVMRFPFLLPAVFFAGGFITRSILRETETRWQMAWFAALALVLWLTQRRQVSPVLVIGSGAAAWIGILIAKFSIEGFHLIP